MSTLKHYIKTYRLRLRRKRFLYRAAWKSRQLRCHTDRTAAIAPHDILCFMTVRNEMLRLPYVLEYYRTLGIAHFCIVDNGSNDGTTAFLAQQADVSLWTTQDSYKLSRFGMDWLTWLQWRYAHEHWALTVDADELLVYPDMEKARLPDLTAWLSAHHIPSFGAVMIDLYPKGPLSANTYRMGDNPVTALPWFDPAPLRITHDQRFERLWIQGGVRDRVFFQDRPERAPTLNKVPLVYWQRGYAYVSSTHHALPAHLNHVFPEQAQAAYMRLDKNPRRLALKAPSGALLHTKFLPNIQEKSTEEQHRRQHFENSTLYESYYDDLIADVPLWTSTSQRYKGPKSLLKHGFMSSGQWEAPQK